MHQDLEHDFFPRGAGGRGPLVLTRRHVSVLSWALAMWALVSFGVGCKDESDLSGASGGGTTTTTSAGGTTSTGGTGGGTGGDFTGCDTCGGEKPVCVDDAACAAACPDGRDLCHPAGASPGGACCEAGAQCCEAAVFGYATGDLCRPDGEACPLGCAGSDLACPIGKYCKLVPQTGVYFCTDYCDGTAVCGFNGCCPTGASCEDGQCRLADLTIDAALMAQSAHVEVAEFGQNACELGEMCVGGPGKRTLLKFDLRTPNIGDGDLFLGNPAGNGLFQYSPCHNHYHFTSYADYKLLDANGDEAASGHKQAFCLEDVDPNTKPPMGDAKYDCQYQGIQAGWADVYPGWLPCQWIDVTGVPPGDYTLHVSLNYLKLLAESKYDNDKADVMVTIPLSSCPNDCQRTDAMCCLPGDPCGWAANGRCDCSDHFGWDSADCGACISSDPLCLTDSSCPAGCTENTGACCVDGDPCGLANNFACDCAGQFSWDDADCKHCNDPDPPCPPNTCPNGCTAPGDNPQCCADGDPCGWAGDGYCDCAAMFAWDAKDCGHCTAVSPACPP